MDPFRLDGEIALITGGGTGLGLATAKRMAEVGAKVVICGRREEKLKEAIEHIGHDAAYEVFDVSDLQGIPDFVKRLNQNVGAPSILVNNAGINMKKPALETTNEEFDNIIKTNVHGVFALTREIAPAMIEKKKGAIVILASMASLIGLTGVVAYSSSKSAVLGITRTLANEWAKDGVRVNAIAPGFIETPMVRKAVEGDEERKHRIMIRTPMGRLGEPEDIGNAAVFLCSQASKYITGTTLVVDGGTSIGF